MAEHQNELTIINLHKSIHQPGSPIMHPDDNWLVLGHFDSLSLGSIPPEKGRHMLEQVWEDLSKPKEFLLSKKPGEKDSSLGVYRHALYLLPADIPPASGPETWPFMFVTRICKSNSHGGTDSRQSIEDTVRIVMGDTEDLSFQCYPTLCISDLILITRSHSLQTLMDKIKDLFTCPYIGDTYTYACLSRAALNEPDKHGLSCDDHISLASVRLAVRSHRNAEKTLRSWYNLLHSEKYPAKMADAVRDAYFVTGTSDANILLRDVSSYDLTRFFRLILSSGAPNFWESFDDMITRLGVLFQAEGGSPCGEGLCRLPCRDDLPEINSLYTAFSRENQKLRQFLRNERSTWINPLFDLMNSLICLSKNRTLDQLGYVLLSSVQGFRVKLQEHEDKSNYVDDIYTFVDQLAFVKEHIIRMESQLVLHPETRPVLFSLPVNTIESYLTFIDLCAHFLQIEDQERDKRHFFFLIVPRLCEMVAVQSLLYDRDEKNHLLYIRIPLELCYTPKEVALALAHEIGHYSGEFSRNREVRFKTLIYCCSMLLCRQLGYRLEQTAILHRVFLWFFRRIPQKDRKLMRDIEPAIESCCRELICETATIYELRDAAIEDIKNVGERYGRMDELNRRYEEILRRNSINYVLDVMKEVQMLCQECYADVAMFSLLSVSSLDYIQLIWSRRYSGMCNPSPKQKDLSRVLLIERISLVILTARRNEVERLPQDAQDEKLPKEIMDLISSVADYCTVLNSGACSLDEQRKMLQNIKLNEKDPKNLPFHPLEITQSLLTYLRTCYDDMPKKTSHTEWDQIDSLYKSLCDSGGSGDSGLEGLMRDYRAFTVRDSLDSDSQDESSLKDILYRFHSGLADRETTMALLTEELHLSPENADTILNLPVS